MKKTIYKDEINISYVCPYCNTVVNQTLEDVSFTSGEAECSSCGSHGGIDAAFTCPTCKRYTKVEVSSW